MKWEIISISYLSVLTNFGLPSLTPHKILPPGKLGSYLFLHFSLVSPATSVQNQFQVISIKFRSIPFSSFPAVTGGKPAVGGSWCRHWENRGEEPHFCPREEAGEDLSGRWSFPYNERGQVKAAQSFEISEQGQRGLPGRDDPCRMSRSWAREEDQCLC